MFQRILFHWKSHLINRFLHKKYFYWVSCFKIGFYDDNVNVINKEITYEKYHKRKYSSKNNSVKKKPFK